MPKDTTRREQGANAPDWVRKVTDSPIAHVLAAAEVGVYQIDTATGLASWDKVASCILGRGGVEQIHPARLPIHSDDVAEVSRRLERISGGGGKRDVDLRIIRPSGELRWVRSSARLAPDQGHKGRQVVGVLTDITEQRNQAVALAEAERDVNELLDSLPHIIWSTDANGNSTFLSSQWFEFTGRDPNGDIGKPWAAAIHPDDQGPVLANWHKCVREGLKLEAEFRLSSQSGGYRWVAATGLPQYNNCGELTCWRGTCTDVHDRVLAERALAETQDLQRTAVKRLRSTLDLIPQMVWSMEGSQRRPDFYNKRWYEFTGLQPASLDGTDWEGLYHPDDMEQALEVWRQSRQTGENYDCIYRVRDREGNYRWVRSEGCSEKNDCGEILRWYGTCTDIHESVLQQQVLQESEKRAHRILNSVPHVIWTAGADGKLDFLSDQWARTLVSPAPKSDREYEWLQAVHPNDLRSTVKAWRAARANCEPYEAEFRVRWGPTGYRWILARATPDAQGEGEAVRWYGTCTDIHDRVLAKQALHESERLSRGIIEATPDCMSLLDTDGVVLFVNEAVLEAYSVQDAAALLGRRWASSFKGALRTRADAELKRARQGEIGRMTICGGPSGQQWFDVLITPIRIEDGRITRLLVCSRDVTDQKKAQEEAQWAANHDVLTGLPNRFLIQSVIDEELARADTDGFRLGLILLDADHLKRINDGLGHDAGDAMLCEIGRRLKTVIGADGVVGRLGGDEFAVVLRGATREDLDRVAQSLMGALEQPFAFAGRMIECHASGGAAAIEDQTGGRTELMKNADIALYAAKSGGRGRVAIFEPSLRLALEHHDSMLGLARSALDADLITAHYQPQVDLRTGKTAGVEALLRWELDGRQVQGPETIAAAFEDPRLAARMSDRIIEAVIRDVVAWRAQGLDFGHVAINAAAAEFCIGGFAERLLERLAMAKIPPAQIQLEVTETVFLGRGAEYVHRALELLSTAGMTIALDDFGTGYASLSHLRQFPVDVIKIDRSFVRDVGVTDDATAIVSAVISLGTNLNMKVVAEGIETREQERCLQRLGCHFGQGFLYAKAVSPRHLAETLERLNGNVYSGSGRPRRAA